MHGIHLNDGWVEGRAGERCVWGGRVRWGGEERCTSPGLVDVDWQDGLPHRLYTVARALCLAGTVINVIPFDMYQPKVSQSATHTAC